MPSLIKSIHILAFSELARHSKYSITHILDRLVTMYSREAFWEESRILTEKSYRSEEFMLIHIWKITWKYSLHMFSLVLWDQKIMDDHRWLRKKWIWNIEYFLGIDLFFWFTLVSRIDLDKIKEFSEYQGSKVRIFDRESIIFYMDTKGKRTLEIGIKIELPLCVSIHQRKIGLSHNLKWEELSSENNKNLLIKYPISIKNTNS